MVLGGHPPFVVVEGPPIAVRSQLDAGIASARAAGWRVIRGWAAPLTGERVVCTGSIGSADEARRALLAAVSGAGLIVGSRTDAATVARFVDDLRRLGPVEHVVARAETPLPLTAEHRALLGLLGEGLGVEQAAAALGITRRTADRRLASAKRALEVASTEEAIVAAISGGR